MSTARAASLPLLGLLYIFKNRLPFGKGAISSAIPTLGAAGAGSVSFLAVLYTKGWSVQGGVIKQIFGNTWAAFAATQAVLAAEAAVVFFFALRLMTESYNNILFDEVLARQGCKNVQPFSAAEMTELKAAAERRNMRSSAAAKQRSIPVKLLHWVWGVFGQRIVTAPLLLIPGVGLLIYVYANAQDEGSKYHQRYLKRKGVTDPTLQRILISRHSREYQAFGIVQMLLNLVPVANYLFALGGAVGAAIWAADIEADQETWVRSEGGDKDK